MHTLIHEVLKKILQPLWGKQCTKCFTNKIKYKTIAKIILKIIQLVTDIPFKPVIINVICSISKSKKPKQLTLWYKYGTLKEGNNKSSLLLSPVFGTTA